MAGAGALEEVSCRFCGAAWRGRREKTRSAYPQPNYLQRTHLRKERPEIHQRSTPQKIAKGEIKQPQPEDWTKEPEDWTQQATNDSMDTTRGARDRDTKGKRENQ